MIKAIVLEEAAFSDIMVPILFIPILAFLFIAGIAIFTKQ